MTKDAFWFPHDSNARRDPKMMRLRMKHGQKGKAFYWDAIEFLREQPDYQATQEDFEALEFEIGKEGSGMTEALIDAKLLKQEDGFIFSKSLKERMFKWDEKKRKLSEAGKRGGRPRKGSEKGGFKQDKPRQKGGESQPKAITEYNITEENSTEHNTNTGAPKDAPKNKYSENFEEVWKKYPARKGRKVNKPGAYKEYKLALKKVTHEIILKTVVDFASTQSAKDGFAPDMDRWIKKDPWDDESTEQEDLEQLPF